VIAIAFLVTGVMTATAAIALLAHRAVHDAVLVVMHFAAMAAQVALVPIVLVMLQRAHARSHAFVDLSKSSYIGACVFGLVLLASSTSSIIYTRWRLR
jgi:hypothetical protein